METLYTNAPWFQLQIHPSTWQLLKFCSVAQGVSIQEYLKGIIHSGILSVLSDIYDSDLDAEKLAPRIQVESGPAYP